MKIMETISTTLEKSVARITAGYPIERESDFQSVFFGELYKELPTAIIRFEKVLQGDYQSYIESGKSKGKRKSRTDIHVVREGGTTVIEMKYVKGAGVAAQADMLADIAKVERIIEAKEADDGFCIQLFKPGVAKRLSVGPVTVGSHQPKISGWHYDFEIKGKYQISPSFEVDGHATILHHIK